MLNYTRYNIKTGEEQFDTHKFLQDYKVNADALKSLKEQRGELTEISALGYEEKIKSSPKQDGLENLAIQRLKLSATIKVYEQYFKNVERALNALTEDERTAINCFYFGGTGYKRAMSLLHVSQTGAFRIRNRALAKISKVVSGL